MIAQNGCKTIWLVAGGSISYCCGYRNYVDKFEMLSVQTMQKHSINLNLFESL